MREPAEKAAEPFRIMHQNRNLILIACSILFRCDMRISLHVQNAASREAARDEIIDAGLLAAAMGGSPERMSMRHGYKEAAKRFD